MKYFIIILTIMSMSKISHAQDGKATTIKKTFSRETTVQVDIQADPTIIWSLLTNAADMPRWNSTIISIDGNIQKGEKIKLKSTLDPKRTFKLKVKAMNPEQEIIWGDGTAPFFSAKRRYTLTNQGNGIVTFNMTEKMKGLMFPMAAKQIPPFDGAFEQFAADLKKEAEIIQNQK